MNEEERLRAEQFTAEQAELLREVADIVSDDPNALRCYVNVYRWGRVTLWLIRHGGPVVAVIIVLWAFGLDFIESLVNRLREWRQ